MNGFDMTLGFHSPKVVHLCQRSWDGEPCGEVAETNLTVICRICGEVQGYLCDSCLENFLLDLQYETENTYSCGMDAPQHQVVAFVRASAEHDDDPH